VPEVLKRVVPKYPEIARKAGIEGRVFLHLLIGRDGRVQDVKFIKGPPVFKEAAMQAGKEFLFTPAMQNDKPVRVWMALPLTFSLRD
jgi:protein TonB